MAKPAAHVPSAPAATPPPLAPAEDNGVPYVERHAQKPSAKRSGTPLGLRIDEGLKSRLTAVSKATGIPMSTLLRRILDEGLKPYER